jgi:hypothetical protein
VSFVASRSRRHAATAADLLLALLQYDGVPNAAGDEWLTEPKTILFEVARTPYHLKD